MAGGDAERRLVAIVAIDVAGYSRLMGADEQGTLATLKSHRDAVTPLVERRGGRLVGQSGDGLLLEFPSVVEAVTCAIEMQAAMMKRNAGISDDRQMLFRVGINLGDVLVEGNDIYGDGVNVAARIEALAEPGGVCISRTVRDNVRDRMDINLQDMGEVEVKNIARPVRVFRLLTEGEPAPVEKPMVSKAWLYGAAAAVVLVGLVGAGQWWGQRPDVAAVGPTPSARVLSDKPSIAVLPFQNLSGDPEQEYFADGMAEDIITDLSKLKALFVIARNTTFQYKGKKIDVVNVGKALKVRYVLEGSVRRAGNQVRINAQLIDSTTGGHLWAERYDGDMSDVFKLQDQMTQKIVSSLALVLDPAAKRSLTAKETDNPEAYDAFLRGMRHLNVRDFGLSEFVLKARLEFKRAVELDPNFARAYAGLGMSYWDQWAAFGMDKPWLKDKALEYANKSLALKDNALALRLNARQYFAPYIVASASYQGNRHDLAVAELRKAIALEPNNADVLAELASTLVFSGGAKEAAELMERAMRLNPSFPNWYHQPAGIAHYLNREYAKAVAELQTWVDRVKLPTVSLLWLSAALAQSGSVEQATASLDKIRGRYRLEGRPLYLTSISYWHSFGHEEDWLHLREGLIKAGLREAPE